MVARFEVWLIQLDPTIGSEIRKTRPCLVISPDEMNRHLATALIAPMTSAIKGWPVRVAVRFQGKKGEVALDQIRAVDKRRLIKKLGSISSKQADEVVSRLLEMFA